MSMAKQLLDAAQRALALNDHLGTLIAIDDSLREEWTRTMEQLQAAIHEAKTTGPISLRD